MSPFLIVLRSIGASLMYSIVIASESPGWQIFVGVMVALRNSRCSKILDLRAYRLLQGLLPGLAAVSSSSGTRRTIQR